MTEFLKVVKYEEAIDRLKACFPSGHKKMWIIGGFRSDISPGDSGI